MATVKKFATGRTRSFANLKEAEKAFENQELEVNVECNIGNKLTTYGRAKLSKLVNIDIEQFLKYNEQIEHEDLPPEMAKLKKVKGEPEEHYKERVAKANKEYKKAKTEFDSFQNYKKDRKYREMNAIGMKNIGKLLLAMGSHPNKVQEYLDMQKFAMQIATIVGLGPVPYNDLFTGISQEEIDAIIKAPFESTDPNERNAEAMERKNKLRKLFAEELEKNIVNLPDSNIRELQQSMSKVSLKKLLIVYTPSILGDTLEDLAATVGDSLFDGLSERSYVAMAEQNRQTLDLKQQLVPVSKQKLLTLNSFNCWKISI